MFTTLIVQPIFNLLVLIYALLPGHNFGLALIIFTIVIRMLMWPLVRKQLHQAKQMRKLQPELKRIKAATKGNRAKEQQMVMELYKERGINPFGTIPTLIIQFVVLIGLYSGLRRVISNPLNLVTFAYPFVRHITWIHILSGNIHRFDDTLLGFISLSRSALKPGGGIYWPAMVIVLGSAIMQYYQAKQLMPDDKEKRGLRKILKEASSGKQTDQAEINAAVSRSTRYLLPVMIFIFTVSLPAALSLYWLTGGIVAFIQQSIILRRDETEMEAIADKPSKKDVAKIPEAEVVAESTEPTETKNQAKSSPKPSSHKSKKKRRKR